MKVLFGLWGDLGLRICDFRKHHPDHGDPRSRGSHPRGRVMARLSRRSSQPDTTSVACYHKVPQLEYQVLGTATRRTCFNREDFDHGH